MTYKRRRAINTKILSEFGNRVETLRMAKGISRESLIKELAVTMKTYTSWLSDDPLKGHEIKLSSLLKLCDLLECDVDFLLDRIKEENHNTEYICKQTGLSELAVKRLIDWNNGIIGDKRKHKYINNENANNNYIKTLNRLLTCGDVEGSEFFLSDIADYFFAEEILSGIIVNKDDPKERFKFNKLSDVAILQGEISYTGHIDANGDIKVMPIYHNHTGRSLSSELLKEVAIKEIQKDLEGMIIEERRKIEMKFREAMHNDLP